MGNILGHIAAGGRHDVVQTGFRPNIPVDVNNPNQPCQSQMRDMLLHFTLPIFCIAALAYREYENKKCKEDWYHQQEEAMTRLHKSQHLRYAATAQQKQSATFREILAGLEKDENGRLEHQLQKLRYYDDGLKTILDIRCSLFKDSKKRLQKQDELVTTLTSRDLDVNGIVTYSALKEIYDYDWLFCGSSKETNGKLRHLYVDNWRLKLQLEKYQNIVSHMKAAMDSK